MNPPPKWRKLLWPLALPYSAAARARAWCYDRKLFHSKRLAATVISVGNLTAGGTGKTPMVMWLADQLTGEGKRVAILTRGYRGSANGGQSQSDEVALLRAHFDGKVKIGVGADRYRNGADLARNGTDFFVLDDGYQHLKLARDADIVLIDAMNPFGGGMMLPAGLLREPMSALRRADILVVTRCMQPPARGLEAALRRYTDCPIFYARTALLDVLRLPDLEEALPPERWTEARFFAFCAIGNPAAFTSDLSSWNFQVVGTKAFSDHHVYTEHEFRALQDAAAGAGAEALLCTEKDVWNLRGVRLEGLPVYCCRIAMELPRDAFRRSLDEAIASRGRERAQ